ncbi:hypothetical protein LMG33818_000372 [Halomonadaceae bacterium LMG 33818]
MHPLLIDIPRNTHCILIGYSSSLKVNPDLFHLYIHTLLTTRFYDKNLDSHHKNGPSPHLYQASSLRVPVFDRKNSRVMPEMVRKENGEQKGLMME